MVVLGITGPTGAGKTTALNELNKLGGAVIDCDTVYHEMLESDKTLQCMLISEFGDITDDSGGIDRKKLGKLVFGDADRLAALDHIVHGQIYRRVEKLIADYRAENHYAAAAIDAIGLVESGLTRLCDATLAITAPAEVRVARIMAREGIPEDYARSRVLAQKPDSFFFAHCDHVLVNDCATREEFAQRSRELLQVLLY